MAGEGTLVDDLKEEINDDEDQENGDDAVDDKNDHDDETDGDSDAGDASASSKDGSAPDSDGDGDDDDDDGPVTLDALEAEELEIVETEENATMLVDEASEIMAIRRAEMSLGVEADTQRGDEFVCQSCFLVLKSSQLANKRKLLCVDCV